MLSEPPGIDFVHRGEIAHPLEEDGGLHHPAQVGPRGAQHRLEIGEHPLGLLGDAAVHDLHGGGVEGDLARGEDQVAAGDRLAVGADRLGCVGSGHESDLHQKSPSIRPSAWTRIASAAGVFDRPGIVMMSPASATTNPAPAEAYTSRMVIRNPDGRPSRVGSSLNEYCVLAMQTGVAPRPIASHWAIARSAAGW